MSAGGRPRVLLVGGGGGFVGRQLLPLLLREFDVRSIHRHPVASEAVPGVEWVEGDVARLRDWTPVLRDVQVVVNLAWYRWARPRRFEELYGGLRGLLTAAIDAKVHRFLQLSVPAAPLRMERELPYLRWKRRFDQELTDSGLSYAIVRPTLLFGPGDVLLSVMLRMVRRYPFFPMFGDGSFRVNPLAVADLARQIRKLAGSSTVGQFDLGGPETFRYRQLTDLLFRVAGRRPRYWTMNARNGIRLAGLLQSFGSNLLYAYEVEWLMSDLLVQPVAEGIGGPLERVEPYLRSLLPPPG
ncbi:MAG: NAD(P)H-binding protein [Thermoplasmata archaeon]|nr:NAD(P)H-binding protein [Thermoplasmata archaeon]